MRKVLLALSVLAAVAAPVAAADDGWKGPGWYQVADTIVGPFLWAGPFATEAECKPTLPPNEDDADYKCEYVSENPHW